MSKHKPRASSHNQQKHRPRPDQEKGGFSSDVSTSPEQAHGAFAVGGRRGDGEEADTMLNNDDVIQEENIPPPPERRGKEIEDIPVAELAAELVPDQEDLAKNHQKKADDVPFATAQTLVSVETPWFQQRRSKLVLFMMLLLVVGIVVAVVIPVTGRKKGGQGSDGTRSQSPTPTDLCANDGESSCIGDQACIGESLTLTLCAQEGSCNGRRACHASANLTVSEGSCVGKSK